MNPTLRYTRIEVLEGNRAGILENGEAVIGGRFGGEGTGRQSKHPFEWEIGKPSKFLTQAQPVGDFAEFS